MCKRFAALARFEIRQAGNVHPRRQGIATTHQRAAGSDSRRDHQRDSVRPARRRKLLARRSAGAREPTAMAGRALISSSTKTLCRTLDIPLLRGPHVNRARTPTIRRRWFWWTMNSCEKISAATCTPRLGDGCASKGNNEPWREIVGVVRHVTHYGLEEHARGEIYRPWLQVTADDGQTRFSLPARDGFRGQNRGPTELVSSCDQSRAAQGRQRSPARKRAITLEEIVPSIHTATRRFNLGLITAFALLALASERGRSVRRHELRRKPANGPRSAFAWRSALNRTTCSS